MKSVTVYFDYVSPFAYLMSEVLPRLAERVDVGFEWTPVDMLKLANFASGLPYSPAKRRYVALDAMRQAEFHDVPIRPPVPFPVESGAALRLASAARDEPWYPTLHRALFHAAWQQQRDLSSPEVLAECIERAGGRVAEWRSRAASNAAEERLAAATATAEALGVFGVPSLLLDGELFWGLDCLPVLEWRLTRTRV